ncbi:adenylate kinase [uncultured Arthrobacter sp.]|uniref:adenylate kinase n=1 Tax=uncultured Arthrobacter sp. TaxID=114050 RepID=UPI0025FCAA2E|nr:adenylate kinase [uncultured Arthrobacter sp.]
MPGAPAQRVVFHGVTGSGKSSAARAYAAAARLPEYSADDDVGWLPGWQNRPPEEQRLISAGIAAQERWVIDSAYSGWRDILLARAELVVALDYPRWLSLWRLIRRTIRRCVTREQVCNGNIESFRRVFTRDSILLWHFTAFPRKREALERMKADPSMPRVISFRRPADLDAWIDQVGRDAAGA